ncbi:MAG: sugar phosphate isomerase/epimerase [Gemmatimonadaceae bacterium]|nr:sugar phosphate isomerase/epimerase [Gemmatimonadaceae bacterium]
MQLLLNTIMLEPNRWTAEHALTRPLVDLLDPIASAGFRELEVWGYHLDRLSEAEVEHLAGALQARGMRAVGVGAYPSFHLEGAADEEQRRALDRLLAATVHLGASVFKIFPGRVASADAGETVWRRSVEGMRRLAGRTAEADMLLTLETHGGTLCDTLEGTRRLLDQLPEDGVGICFQPYVEHDTAAAIAAFDALGPRVRHLHLQNRGPGGPARLEEGDWTDYRRFLPHVRRSGFDGPMCLEFTAGITPAEGEAFDLAGVLANAARDRAFVGELWRP